MVGKNFRQDLAHPLSGSVLDAFNATKQNGVGINFNFGESTRRFSQRGRWGNENNQISIGTRMQISR
jgi:hypothetical protein